MKFQGSASWVEIIFMGLYKNIYYIFYWLWIFVSLTLEFNFFYIAVACKGSRHHFMAELNQKILNLGEECTREWQKLFGQLPVFCVQLNRAVSVQIPRASEMQEGSCCWRDHISCICRLENKMPGKHTANYTDM